MGILIDIGTAVFTAFWISKLMNDGDFDLAYCAAALAGIFVFPILLPLLVPDFAGAFLGSHAAYAALGCLLYDGVKRSIGYAMEMTTDD